MDSSTNPHTSALQAMLDQQHQAQQREPMAPWSGRASRLATLRDSLLRNKEAICQAISKDFSCRATEETLLLELFPSIDGIKHALKHGRRWMRPQRSMAGFWFMPARTELLPQPLGVIGIIVPWNYPLYLAVGPIIDALTAGNRVMVKMSEHTPVFSELFADLMQQAFPQGEVRVVTGDAEVAQAFSALPFDHLLFTGSTAIGRHVMRAAASNLTPVTLELGGKSPVILAPDADLDKAVERIIYGKCVNAGQTCIAPDYVLLPDQQVQAFVDAARRVFKRMYPDFARDASYTSIISDRQQHRLQELLDQAVAEGAQTHPLTHAATSVERRMPPTLLTGVDPTSPVMQEEIFGPLLPLIPYASLDQALDFVDARPHPLALYLFARHKKLIRRVLDRHLAGGVTVNDTLYHIAQHKLPFGGVGDSGMGAYHGRHGFETFSKMKPIFRQARFNGVGLLNPPYGPRFQRMLKLMLRR